MSGVVLRCPNCGTTRAAPGECEACHEAQVRHYCTNHTPGRWLDACACPQCGARFGEPPRPPRAPAPAAPVRAPAPVAAARPASPAALRSPYPSPGRPRAGGEASERRERLPPAAEAEVDSRDERPAVRTTTWHDLLRAAARARPVPPLPREAAPYPEAAPRRRGPGGCLLRVVLLFMFLFVAFATAPFLFGRALLQMFGIY